MQMVLATIPLHLHVMGNGLPSVSLTDPQVHTLTTSFGALMALISVRITGPTGLMAQVDLSPPRDWGILSLFNIDLKC